MANVNELPVEIIETIFYNLDGISFLQVAQVCCKWNIVTKNMQRTFWKEVCIREMDITVIEELMGYRNCCEVAEDNFLWRSAYFKWKRGMFIADKCASQKSIRMDNNPISCVKTSGSWVLTGHRSGTVYAWDFATGLMGQVLIQHLLMVNDFVLIDVLNAGPYAGNSSQRDFRDVWDHHHIISVSKDPTVQVNSLLSGSDGIDQDLEVIHYHNCGLDFIRVFGKHVAMSSSDNTILLFQMEYVRQPRHHLDVKLLKKVIGPSEVLRTFNYWRNEFLCFCTTGTLKVFRTSEGSWKTILPYMMPCTGQTAEAVQRNTICGAFLFRDAITFLPTIHAKVLVSTNSVNYSPFSLLPTIPSNVVCISMYSSILALGTETGQLMLYHIPGKEELLTWNIEQPTWRKTLSEASIVCINISCNCKTPVIAACTTEYIYVLQWHAQSV